MTIVGPEWRDHGLVTSKAATADADPLVVLVTGVPGSGKTSVARALSVELGLPLLSLDAIKETLFDALGVRGRDWSLQVRRAALQVMWSVLPDCPAGALIDVWLDPTRDVKAADTVRLDRNRILEVLCDVPVTSRRLVMPRGPDIPGTCRPTRPRWRAFGRPPRSCSRSASGRRCVSTRQSRWRSMVSSAGCEPMVETIMELVAPPAGVSFP